MATGNDQSMKQTDQVSKPSPLRNAQISHSVWQEAYEGAPAIAAVVPKAAATEQLAAKLAKPCSPSPAYQKFIDLALSESYAPETFGDPKKIRHEFDCQINNVNDAINYANQVLSRSGDSYTQILLPAANQARVDTADPNGTGFGIETTFDARNSSPGNNHGVAIYRTYSDSPATQAGLKTGDIILSVDSQDLTQLSFDDADAKLNDPAGSVAHLLVERNGERLSIDAVRKDYHRPSVSDVSLPDNLAYISIEDFRNAHGAEQLRAALLKHKDAKGFVIDLRDNGGGNIDESNLALSEVMKNGPIMKVRERNLDDKDHVSYLSGSYELTPNGIVLSEKAENSQSTFQIGSTNEVVTFDNGPQLKQEVWGRMQNLVGDRPVVILINGGTASAAEIFTGAEHDTGDGRTIGTTSYGKGIGGLYTSKKLPAGAGEVVTYMRYFTPSGLWPGDAAKHRYGLKPDVEVFNPYGAIPTTAADVQLIAAENDLKNTLRKRN
jgi:C-terminal processing protease CtpA/Prc